MNKPKILLIITGSVACYKSLELIRLLKKNSFEVNCVLTKGAKEFITPLLVSALSGTKTYDDLFCVDDEINMGHINLSRQNDLVVVVPASADFIAKIANGYADDLASSIILASNKKLVFAPAMNEKMWLNPSTQSNVKTLINRGAIMIEPQKDILACGEEGIGKMSDINNIYEKIENHLKNRNILSGKKIIITAGATHEAIDPVRFIGNKSSGKQALYIAQKLSEFGANITLIAGNLTQNINFSLNNIIFVNSAQEMLDSTIKSIELLNDIDVFIGCSAVADYRVKNYSSQKIKKNSQPTLTIELERNPDILHQVANHPKRPKFVIGFCAESENLLLNAQQKLVSKNCDLIIANHIDNGKIFGSDNTSGYIVNKDSEHDFSNITKVELADLIVKIIIKNLISHTNID